MNLSDNWKEKDNKLILHYECEDFVTCVDYLTRIAGIAEEQDHHPNICIKDYNNLEIEVYTHAEDALTPKDWNLAQEIDAMLFE